MVNQTPTVTTSGPLSKGKRLTSSTLQTLMILAGGADLAKANLFFEDFGAKLKGKVYGYLSRQA